MLPYFEAKNAILTPPASKLAIAGYSSEIGVVAGAGVPLWLPVIQARVGKNKTLLLKQLCPSELGLPADHFLFAAS